VVSQIKAKDPQHDVYLVGHSLGGSTAHQAMVKSKYVRDNVKELHTFNAGSSPLQHKGLSSKHKAYSTIAAKSTHHRIAGDEISASIKSNLIGTHKTYKNTQKPSLGKAILNIAEPLLKQSPLGRLVHFGANKIIDTLSSHSLKNFIKQ
jgi:triacylglycerol esterase/lipase EstA (alpha/beta hydrolase family)